MLIRVSILLLMMSCAFVSSVEARELDFANSKDFEKYQTMITRGAFACNHLSARTVASNSSATKPASKNTNKSSSSKAE